MRYSASDSPPSSSVNNNSVINTALHQPPATSQANSSVNSTRQRHFSTSLLQDSQPSSTRHNHTELSPDPRHRRFHSSRSPSLKAALSDPSLSATLNSAVPERWDRDRDREASKARFERNVRRYFFQLTVGCGVETCTNRLCRSSSASPKLTSDAAAIMSVQLASRPRLFLCENCPENPVIAMPKATLPFGSVEATRGVPAAVSSGSSPPANRGATGESRPQTPVKPFLYSLFASPSFANIFAEAEIVNDSVKGNRQRSEAATAAKSRLRNVHNDGTASASCSPRASPRRVSNDTGVRTVLSGLSNVIFGRPKPTEKPSSTISASNSSHHHEAEHITADSNRGGFATPTTPWRSKSLFDLPSLFSSSTSMSLRDKQHADKTNTALTETDSFLEGYISPEGQIQFTDIPGDCCPDTKMRSSVDPASVRNGEAYATHSRKPWGRHQRCHTANTDSLQFTKFTPSASAALPLNDDAYASSSGSDGEDIELSLTYLTLPLLEQAIATYRTQTRTSSASTILSPEDPSDSAKEGDRSSDSEREDPSFLINTIRTVFSSSDALGKSFLLDSTTDVPISSSGLDLPSLRISYNLILDLEPKHLFTTALTNAMEILVARLEMNNRTLAQRPEGLRQLLILLENPMLRDQSHHEVLMKKITRIIAGLNKKAKSILVHWFSEYHAHAFTTIVNIFQTYLADHYTPNPRGEDAAVLTVKVLSLLCSANQVNADGMRPEPILPIDAFYNEPLCRRLNFKDEYRQWKKSREKGNGSKTITIFSYFNYPFLFDPVAKSRIMHIDAMMQMFQEYEDACVQQAMIVHAQKLLFDSTQRSAAAETGSPSPYLVFSVRREMLVQDALNLVNMKENDLKKPMKVKFVGGGEDGMDQGGVQKEFFQVLVAQLLDPSYGMFTYDEETRFCWINGNSLEPDRKFEQVGIILGLALYNGIIIGASFPRLFYKKLLGEHIGLEDVKEAFPSLGNGLSQMLTWTDGDVADVFMRSFEISYDVYGQVKTIPLVDGGEFIPVTNENRKEYVRLYIDHLTHDAVDRQFRALKLGFHKVCGGVALQMCLPEELELLLCGSGNLDFEDLEKGAMYDDGYFKDHPLIRHFWSIVHGLTLDQKKKLLLFVTASDRVPIKGLAEVTFVIQRNGPDSERLPTALTCFGRLLLPEYSTRTKLSERLLTAIENSTGFGLL